MCTSLRLRAADGSVAVGRTMEFGADFRSQLRVVPSGVEEISRLGGGSGPARWITRYGWVGMDTLDLSLVTDGMNEAGLYVGALYLPDFTEYEQPQAARPVLASETVANFVLGQAASVAEALTLLDTVSVVGFATPEAGEMVLPSHLTIHDAGGAAAVVEWVDGTRRVHDNPLGVVTNAPTFDWHLINLRNFVNLRPANVPELDLFSASPLAAIGQGSGLLGLPGDWTPPSRFVRAVALSQSADEPADSDAAVLRVQQLMGTFTIVPGLVREGDGTARVEDITYWTTVADLAAGRYYWNTIGNSAWRYVSLDRFDLTGGEVRRIPLGDDLAHAVDLSA